MNTTTPAKARLARPDVASPTELPPPTGAVKVYDWHAGANSRQFEGRSRLVEADGDFRGAEVYIRGWQERDGRIGCWEVSVGQCRPDALVLSLGQARSAALALIAAVDEAEQMHRDNIGVGK